VFADEIATLVALAYVVYRFGHLGVGTLIAETAYLACIIAVLRMS
jgi:hypothetical protein